MRMSLGFHPLALVYTGVVVMVVVFRKFLRGTDRFSQNWASVMSLAIGMCMGGIADTMIFPSRIGVFLLTTFLGSMFVRHGLWKEVKCENGYC